MASQVIISHYFESTGGVSSYIRGLLRHSDHPRVGNTMLLTPDVSSARDNVVVLQSRSRIGLVAETFSKLWKIRPDHIQVHGPWYFVVATFLYIRSRRLFSKVCPTFFVVKHSEKMYPRWSLALWLHRSLDHLSDGIAFVSGRFMQRYCDEYKYSPSKSFVGYPGLPERDPKQCDVSLNPIEKDTSPYVSYCGLFEYREKLEGLLRLIEAFAMVRHEICDTNLIVIGRGKYGDLVREKIAGHSLEDRVFIVGDCDDPREIIKYARLHCHISMQDSFGLIVLEALSERVPVLVNNFGDWAALGIEGVSLCGESVDEIAVGLRSALSYDTRRVCELPRNTFDWHRTAVLLANARSVVVENNNTRSATR
jgi:glycosyltransferase involved in cell wall biosynthesis